MNRTGLRTSLGLATFALFTACGESTAPDAVMSTVTVRAYVDVDGSGTFTSGDTPVSAATIVLEGADDGSTKQATTDATGVATFADVGPGSYRARLQTAAPAGAVLATATEPVIATSFQGGTFTAEFRFVYNPGQVQGVLYRDNNSNSQFDPTTDTPAPGITVRLIRGTTDTVAATTTTNASGAFSFATVRPGSYTLSFSPLPTMTIVGGNSTTIVVQPGAPTAVNARFTGNLIVPIGQARATTGTVVAVEGIATVAVGIFSTSTTGNQFNVQDATGGVLVLQVPLASGIAQGDSVRVIGTTLVSQGEFVLSMNPMVTIISRGRPLPAPRSITAAQASASTASDPNQGQLVRVADVLVDSVGAGTTAYNVFVTGASGGSFIVRVSTAAVGIVRGYWQVGQLYTVTGTLGSFNGSQVKVRSAADVQVAAQPITIAQARMRALNDTVLVEGIVTAAPGMLRSQGDNMYIQDGTSGIQVFNVPAGLGLQLGDRVRVYGLMGAFGQERQIVRFSATNPLVVTKVGTGTVPAPQLVTAAQTADHSLEGQLVRIENLRVTAVGAASSAGAYTVTMQPPAGGTFDIRIESSAVGIATTFWVVGTNYDVTGVMSRFNAVPQLKPRRAADAVSR